MDKVDDGSMGFTPAVQLSYLKKKEQQEIFVRRFYLRALAD